MSSPIAIPRANVSSSEAEHTLSSSTSSSTGLYIPVHKRGASTSRSASPSTPPSSSWRGSHPPASSPTQRKRGSKGHKASKSQDATHIHIPKQSKIPQHSTVPFVYTFTDLLELAHQPAVLQPQQMDRLASLIPMMPPMQSTPAEKQQATRRRREGRRGKSAQQKVAVQTADVTTRRSRHGHGHGTWGWHPLTVTESQQHDTEETWRHGPAVGVAAA